MSPEYSTPGVFIDETGSGARSIADVATSITAFVGRAWRGKFDMPFAISGYAEYAQQFGGAWDDAPMAAAVQQYFDNGGTQALIVRVLSRDAAGATFTLGSGHQFHAANPGSWGNNLRLTITRDAGASDDDTRFDLAILDDTSLRQDSLARGGSGEREYFANLSMDPASARYAPTFLASESQLLRVQEPMPAGAPSTGEITVDASGMGSDGSDIGFAEVADPALEATRQGIYALLDADLFNLLCIPPFAPDTADNGMPTWCAASQLCQQRRAFLIVDAPRDWDATTARASVADYAELQREHAAIYFPRLLLHDPLQTQPRSCAPCGAIAGVFARTDAQHGVWKAPAGTAANLLGVDGLAVTLTDADQDALNPRGINALRNFSNIGVVTWGTRTLAGDDQLASTWKYIPVRRMALFLEESLSRGTQWVVFEPNGEALWAQLRLEIGAFMQRYFQRGAFQGSKPEQAWFVQCDASTTSMSDLEQGVVNIVVGFAPLKPAEFVVIRISQFTDAYTS
jgi:uncharacterized protein